MGDDGGKEVHCPSYLQVLRQFCTEWQKRSKREANPVKRMIWDLAAGNKLVLLSPVFQSSYQKPGRLNVKAKDLEQGIRRQVADWMHECKTVGEHENLKNKQSETGTEGDTPGLRGRGNKRGCAHSLFLSPPYKSTFKSERKGERESDPGRDGAVGRRLKRLSPAFSWVWAPTDGIVVLVITTALIEKADPIMPQKKE